MRFLFWGDSMKIVIGIIIGYFIGLVSAMLQIIYIEKRDNKKFEDIMKNRWGEWQEKDTIMKR